MAEYFLMFYAIFSCMIAAIDLYVAGKSRQAGGDKGIWLSRTAVFCAAVDLTYLVSISSTNYFTVSLFSSLYFISIDWLLICLLRFISIFTKRSSRETEKSFLRILILYAIFETVLFVVNPFWEFGVSYAESYALIAHYTYVKYPFYWAHLVFTYLMVALAMTELISKAWKAPAQYRKQYIYFVITVLLIVGINAVFLFLPGEQFFSQLDFSILGYSIALSILYWSTFEYARNGMLQGLSMMIFSNLEQGVVLFDYEGRLAMHNRRAEQMLKQVTFSEELQMEGFAADCGLGQRENADTEGYSMQCYVREEGKLHPLRCDYHRLPDQNGRILSYLYVFTDAALETDLLTGFHNVDYFRRLLEENPESFRDLTAAAAFDINSLSVVNSSFGREAGDQKIRSLAGLMRENFPSGTYYVRGHEARLITLCYGLETAQARSCAKKVAEDFDGALQYAVGEIRMPDRDPMAAMEEVVTAMQKRKLADTSSAHSQLMTSLIKALEECDSDTEAHVRRTRKAGNALGERIGLSDMQLSDLSLLCLLHDIGKIGIPLEILNKPGKLSSQEWQVLRSHVEKGYKIAKSSRELSGIAEMILHHHERWDGQGYPDGLSRESIPILSRIIAIVDAYDAMINNRTYRKGIPAPEAQEELKRCAGTQFDPYLVSEFIQLIREQPDLITPDSTAVVRVRPDVFPDKTAGSGHAAENFSIHPVEFSRYWLDEENRIVETDDRFLQMTGYSPEEIEEAGLGQIDLIPEEDRSAYQLKVAELLTKQEVVYLEHKLQKKDGSIVYVFCYGKRYYDSVAQAGRTEIVISDSISTYAVRQLAEEEREKARKRLESWESTYRQDSLTQLLNHAAFQNDVEMELLAGTRRVMMFMIDADKFKEYNDTYGHSAGDEYLILMAQTLKAALRKDDLACRMGGDEFAAALFFKAGTPEETLRERAHQIFEKLQLTMRAVEGGHGISMGAAIAGPDCNTFRQLYAKADESLYRSKEDGRGRLSIAGENG